ncbi:MULTISPECIES: tetratricopeptide repeat protein [unclassified Sphingopyxis]|jgi:cytochrome c-type biogenesis protein CcmH/NrfG|uniref:tetratricopeptide repeat protein n=1 Tax=unclassified Sphingopyxis TaxID=2614943 RepID=UPI0025D432DF|nr:MULTISPECIES: tetratricopeptide repeat protein [unclassified Sphingopyxis]
MIWLWVMLAALLTIAAIVWLGKLPVAARPLAGAAVMLGLAGYALQGSPSLPGKPVAVAAEPEGFGDVLTDQRQGMADRFGPAAQWLGLSDGFARTGKTELAAQTLEKGLEKYPDNVDLWVGLGNALTAHGGGMMSPAAALAFDEAARRDPSHPAPPFFAGLALAQGGDLKGAEAVWSQLLARSPADAPWRPDLEMRLAQLRQALGPQPPPAPGQTP